MKNKNQLILTLTVAAMFAGCGKTSFSEIQEASIVKAEIPLDPVDDIVVPSQPVTGFKVSNGACASDSSTNVLSCLKCDVPVNPQVSQLSAKAQALVDSMYLACQISNKSDHNDFRPTKEQIIEKLNRGSNALYPETTRTAQMELVIQGLTNVADDSLRKTMFSGLWYKPPYSDAFETYFGLAVQEAKSVFCWNGDKKTPTITDPVGIKSKEYIDCLYNSSNPFSCQEKPLHVAGEVYRNQLKNVLAKSISEPYVAPNAVPAKTCAWDKFEGDDIIEAKKQIKKWKSEGRTISMEVTKGDGVGFCGIASESALKTGMTVAMATYSCQ